MITLLGEPISTNHIYRSFCRGRSASVYMTRDGSDLKRSYDIQARMQWKSAPLTGSIIADVKLYFSTKRKHDIDNYSKILLDALTGIVWEDDKQIDKITIEKHFDKHNPRIEISFAQ